MKDKGEIKLTQCRSHVEFSLSGWTSLDLGISGTVLDKSKALFALEKLKRCHVKEKRKQQFSHENKKGESSGCFGQCQKCIHGKNKFKNYCCIFWLSTLLLHVIILSWEIIAKFFKKGF